jgi:hypothetical protein
LLRSIAHRSVFTAGEADDAESSALVTVNQLVEAGPKENPPLRWP